MGFNIILVLLGLSIANFAWVGGMGYFNLTEKTMIDAVEISFYQGIALGTLYLLLSI